MKLAKSDSDWMSGVAGDGIVTVGDPRLKEPTRDVADVAEATSLLQGMTDQLRALNGAGLAAPQVGAAFKVAVIEVRKTDVFPDRPEHPLIQMVNPTIVETGPDSNEDWEGCFSVPGLMGIVPRATDIVVEFTSGDGEQVREHYTGYVARVIQHELDHLDGVEFVDRMTSMESLTTVENFLSHQRPRP